MPMRKRNYRRRRAPRKKAGRRYRTVARIANRVFNKKAEKKYALTQFSVSPSTTTTSPSQITDIAQGDTDVTRDGDQLYVRSIQIQFGFQYNAAPAIVRVLIVQWFPATTPTIADILGSGLIFYNATYNHDQRYNFKVLRDFKCDLTSSDSICSKKIFIKGGFKRKVQYYSGSATSGNNQIYMFYASNLAANLPLMTGTYQINFTDS